VGIYLYIYLSIYTYLFVPPPAAGWRLADGYLRLPGGCRREALPVDLVRTWGRSFDELPPPPSWPACLPACQLEGLRGGECDYQDRGVGLEFQWKPHKVITLFF